MTPGKAFVLAGIALFASAYWWLAIEGHYHYRFRLTLEIETPEGIRSGSSVVEARSSIHRAGWAEIKGVRSALRGEAVFVDLGNGRNLIALLSGGANGEKDWWMGSIPITAFDLEKLPFEEHEAALMGPYQGKRADVTLKLLPTLVSFSDVADAKTARIVPPDGLAQVFGPGFRLSRAWVEMTKDTVTRGIEKRLPALTIQRDWLWQQSSRPNTFVPNFYQFSRD